METLVFSEQRSEGTGSDLKSSPSLRSERGEGWGEEFLTPSLRLSGFVSACSHTVEAQSSATARNSGAKPRSRRQRLD
jgi:hypothetical protein